MNPSFNEHVIFWGPYGAKSYIGALLVTVYDSANSNIVLII